MKILYVEDKYLQNLIDFSAPPFTHTTSINCQGFGATLTLLLDRLSSSACCVPVRSRPCRLTVSKFAAQHHAGPAHPSRARLHRSPR